MPISWERGHWKSERSAAEDIAQLQEEIDRMRPEERAALQVLLDDLQHGRTEIADAIAEDQWEEVPIPIEEWLDSEEHIGELSGSFFPKVKDCIIDIFKAGAFSNDYHECIFSGCVDKDAIVVCEDGSLPCLGDLIGKTARVAAIGEDGVVYQQSIDGTDSGVLRVLEVGLKNGMRVNLTPEHKVLTARGWVEANDLIPDEDWVLTPRHLSYVPSVFDVTEDEAKLLAYWVTDGSSSETRARYCDGRIETGREVIQSLRNLGFETTTDVPYKKNGAWEVHVAKLVRSGFKDWLIRRGIFKMGTSEAEIPDVICRSPLPILRLFVNRVWAAEGTVYSSDKSPPRFQLAMKSERFIRQMQLILLRQNVLSRVYKTCGERNGKPWQTWTLAVSGIDNLLRFTSSFGIVFSKEREHHALLEQIAGKKSNTNVDVVPFTWGEANTFLIEHGIKREKDSEWWRLGRAKSRYMSRQMFERFCEHFSDEPSVIKLFKRFPRDVSYQPVKYVKEVPQPIPVADIGVPGLHRFTANGLSVHNSIGW